jgi:TRAP-type C4-dicarboxylate transport system substrate-binding protein
MKNFCLAVWSAVLLGSAPLGAEEVTFRFTTVTPADYSGNTEVLHPWARRINEQGKGVFRIEVIDGFAVANQGNYYDRLLNDVIQMSHATTVRLSGKFKKTEVVILPFLVDSSETAAVALWRLYKTGMLDDEFDQVVPAMTAVYAQTSVHYRTEPKTIENLNGLKVMVSSKMAADMVTALGGAPTSIIITETYSALQRGVIDAALIGWSGIEPFKIHEVTRFSLDANLGRATPVFVAINKARYLALPEAARNILDANSTEQESRQFGQYLDRSVVQGQKLLHKVGKLPDAATADWRRRIAFIEQDWARETPNGAAVLAKYKALVAEVDAGR